MTELNDQSNAVFKTIIKPALEEVLGQHKQLTDETLLGASFFELGGNSMNIVHFLLEINKRIGDATKRIDVAAIFQSSSLKQLCELLVDKTQNVPTGDLNSEYFDKHYEVDFVHYDATDAELKSIGESSGETFCKDDYLTRFFNISLDECKAEFTRFWQSIVRQIPHKYDENKDVKDYSLSVACYQKNDGGSRGKCVGGMLNCDLFHTDPTAFKPQTVGVQKIVQTLGFFEERLVGHAMKLYAPKTPKIADNMTIFSHYSLPPSDRTLVYLMMSRRLIARAQSLGFDLIQTVNSHVATKAIDVNIFKFDVIDETKLVDIVLKDGSRPFDGADPNESVLSVVKMLKHD